MDGFDQVGVEAGDLRAVLVFVLPVARHRDVADVGQC